MIEGISHVTFIVQDLDRMEKLLTAVFDAQKVYDSGDGTFSISREKFFMIADVWVAIMEGDPLPVQTYNHLAFKITNDEYDDYLACIQSLGLEVREGRSRIEGEGRSIYFYDYDNHMFELHTGTLRERLERYEKCQV